MNSNFSEDTSAAQSVRADPASRSSVIPLEKQFDRLLRAVVLLSVVMALALAAELWQCWQLRPAAYQAAKMRQNLLQIQGTVEQYRVISLRYPELAILGKKYGIEVGQTNGNAAPPMKP